MTVNPKPRSLHTFQIDIVHGCQLRCVGCPNSTLLEKVRRVDVEDFRQRMENVDVDYIQYLRLFNFGEPLLHENLTGIFEVIRAQPWKADNLEISTNAQYCNWEDFESALQLGVLDRLVVSCDGDGTPEHYERLRPPSKWSKLIDFLTRARELRDRHAPGLQLVTRTIIEDEAAMRRWSDLLLPLGWEPEFRDWKVLPQAQENMTGRDLVVPNDVCTFVAPSDRFGELYHGEVNQLYVDAAGTVVPCCAHPKAAELGSLAEHTATQLLASKARQDFVQRLENDRRSIPVCNECEFGPPEKPGESFQRLASDRVELVTLIT
ncbi:MAG: radical SAM protein with 4Fe4S-binding SPASM domain [Bacteroidia bacterium]|jgi:radical SAM protein with 4Fe4S-binding SPASM domain